TLHRSGQIVSRSVTEIDGLEEWVSPSELQLWTRQGPLKSGDVRDMGEMRNIIEHARSKRDGACRAAEHIDAIEVLVAAVCGSEDRLVASSRQFDLIEVNGGPALRPRTIGAAQIRSRSKRQE